MLQRVLIAVVALAVSVAANAGGAVSSDPAFGRFVGNVTGANKTTVGFASNGTSVVTEGVPSVGAPDGGAGFKVSGSGTMVNPAGNRVAITAAGRVANADAALAIGRFMTRTAGQVFMAVGFALSVKQLLDELGYHPFTKADGTQAYGVQKPNTCTVAPCHNFETNGDPLSINADPVASCAIGASHYPNCTPTGASSTDVSESNLTGHCQVQLKCGGSTVWQPVQESSVGTRTPDDPATSYNEVTPQQVQDAIAAKSGWPTSSSVAQAAAEAKTGLQALPSTGNAAQDASDWAPLNVVSPLAAGPATSPGRQTTQVSNNPDGSQRTEQVSCQYNHVYNGADVITTETCGTTVTNDGTAGKTTTSSKTNDTPKVTVAGTPTPATVTVATPTATPASAPASATVTCGLPGTPKCQIDETGTPTSTPTFTLDETTITNDATTKRGTISGNEDKGFFANWTQLFVTPPVVTCTPLSWNGKATIDPCPVVGGVRTIMAWLWALAGFWLCLGWIREAV